MRRRGGSWRPLRDRPLKKRIEVLENLLGHLGKKRKKDYSKYVLDPVAYCREVLKREPTPQQQEFFMTLATEKKVLVPSANQVGKSWGAAALASWHYDCFDPGMTIVSAPTMSAVKDMVFKELRDMRRWDADLMPRKAELVGSHNHFIKGHTAQDSASFQGRHEGSVMVIFDEAEGIRGDFWEAAMSMAHYFIAIYNPTTTSSQAVIEEQSKTWPIVQLSALDHPNIQAELQGFPPLVPNAIRLHQVRDRLQRWGRRISAEEACPPRDIELASGEWYRPGPSAEARVLGRRPTQAVDTVFSTELIHRLMNTKVELKGHWPRAIGVDVARFGDDSTVLHGRIGPCSTEHLSMHGYDNVTVAKRAMEMAERLHPGSARSVPILIDDTGVGGGVTDILRSDDFNAIPITASCIPNVPTDYPNVRSELWFNFADLVGAGLVDFSRLEGHQTQEIYNQLRIPKYSLDNRGRRAVEAKDMMKKRLGRSPDDADAVCLCYYSPPNHKETYS